jgi:hypothetical protein
MGYDGYISNFHINKRKTARAAYVLTIPQKRPNDYFLLLYKEKECSKER